MLLGHPGSRNLLQWFPKTCVYPAWPGLTITECNQGKVSPVVRIMSIVAGADPEYRAINLQVTRQPLQARLVDLQK